MASRVKDVDGTESKVIDEAANDHSVVPVQYDITSFGADYDAEGLVSRLNRGDIIIPSFQRNYIWKQHEASRFIESLLLGLPVPGVFLARQAKSNKLLVIDGQQRLKTLQFYYEGVFNPKEGQKKQQIFRLIKVQKKFEGLTYKSLNEEDKIKLNDSLIHATIVKQESPKNDDTSIYHIFDRLNSEGRRLTPQEIRVAVNHGPLIELLKKLNENEKWRDIYGKKSIRLKDQEMIVRFLALYEGGDTYVRPMNEFINRFCNRHSNSTPDFYEAMGEEFNETIAVIWEALKQKAFKPEGPLNAAVFDSVMVGIARRLDNGPINDLTALRTAYNKLFHSKVYITAVSRATSDEGSVKDRLRITTEAFGSI